MRKKLIRRLEPPALKNGYVTPITGVSPRFDPTLKTNCTINNTSDDQSATDIGVGRLFTEHTIINLEHSVSYDLHIKHQIWRRTVAEFVAKCFYDVYSSPCMFFAMHFWPGLTV